MTASFFCATCQVQKVERKMPKSIKKSTDHFRMFEDCREDMGRIRRNVLQADPFCEGHRDWAEAARTEFKMAADQRLAGAQYAYGVCFFNGDGVERNPEEAVRYFRLAAKVLPEVQYEHALCLFHGRGVKRNIEEAARQFKTAADQGLAKAQVAYGLCLFNGRGVEQNMEEAARYFKMAADQGDSNGHYFCGLCLLGGLGVPKDEVEGAFHLKLAADHGHGAAAYHYALCLLYGIGVEVHAKNAFWYFQVSADSGYHLGQAACELCLYVESGVFRECIKAVIRQQAIATLEELMERGNAAAYYLYALLLYNGDGVPKDRREAAIRFQFAADKEYPDAQLACGLLLATGDGVQQNLEMAVRYFEAAARHGSEIGREIHQRLLELGSDIPASAFAAIDLSVPDDFNDKVAEVELVSRGIRTLQGWP